MNLPKGFTWNTTPVLARELDENQMLAYWGAHHSAPAGMTVRDVSDLFEVQPWLIRPEEKGDRFWWHVTRRAMRARRWIKRRLR